MKRRSFMSTTAVAMSVGIAGCGGSGSGDNPQTVLKNYYAEATDGNADAAMSYQHSNATDLASAEDIAQYAGEETSIEVVEMETLTESDDEVVVETLVTATTPLGTQTATYENTLRRQDGEWKIYESEEV